MALVPAAAGGQPTHLGHLVVAPGPGGRIRLTLPTGQDANRAFLQSICINVSSPLFSLCFAN